MNLFDKTINNDDEWGRVFQSPEAFAPLVAHIFRHKGLRLDDGDSAEGCKGTSLDSDDVIKLKSLTAGTTATFKLGEYVIKIFPPPHLDYIGTSIDVELFGMKLATDRGVPSPTLIAHGEISDKYLFRYIIMNYINGRVLSEVQKNLSDDEKYAIGQKIRKITSKLNAPLISNGAPLVNADNTQAIPTCLADALQHAKNNEEWEEEGFPASFLAERMAYLQSLSFADNEKAFCHSDLNGDNILIDDNMDLYIIDFADGVLAPPQYEESCVVGDLFHFEKPYLDGFYGVGKYRMDAIIDLYVDWLPIQAWGHYMIGAHFEPSEVGSLAMLRRLFFDKFVSQRLK